MPACHSCKKEVEIVDRVGRRDECPHCGNDLHCCLNCEFYDLGYYNDCRETMAVRVEDKDQSNFCEYFKMAGKPFSNEDKVAQAKRKLEELFKKK